MLLYKLIIGVILSALFANPAWLYSPVRFIQWLARAFEYLFRKCFPKNKEGESTAGLCTLLALTVVAWLIPYAILSCLDLILPKLSDGLEILFMFQLLSIGYLRQVVTDIHKDITSGQLQQARSKINEFTGSFQGSLSIDTMITETRDALLNRVCDFIVAPMIFIAIGGVPLGCAYKAISIMAQKAKKEPKKYIYFGKISNKIYWIINYIPKKLTQGLTKLSAWLCGCKYGLSVRDQVRPFHLLNSIVLMYTVSFLGLLLLNIIKVCIYMVCR